MPLNIEPTLTLAVLVSIALAVIRLAFQGGDASRTLKSLAEKVDHLLSRAERNAEDLGDLKLTNTRLDGRVEALERRMSYLETLTPRSGPR